jgi:catechol 2,3-dioxygenase-like lactoylglutathione lyase family enzyme
MTIDRSLVDLEGLNSPEVQALRNRRTPDDIPFALTKLGHVVLNVADLGRSVDFYTQVLGFRVSDAYPASMVPGGMVFMRCNADHHGLALVGGARGPSEHKDMHHLAFEVASLDEVLKARDHLKAHGAPIDFEGRRRAGAQVAVEFRDPDNHRLEIYWGLDQVGPDGPSRPPEQWREAASLEAAIDNPPEGQDTTLADPGLRRD